MRRFKKRLIKKFVRKAAAGIERGNITSFYTKRAIEAYVHFIDKKYLTEFRPWWYEQDWSKTNFTKAHKRFFEQTDKRFEEKYRIDLDALGKSFKNVPKCKRGKSPRKPKPEKPIRKLRNPETFVIRGANLQKQEVIGERCFSYRGYDFMIRYAQGWRVTCIATGLLLSWQDSYAYAIAIAKEKLEQHFEKYIENVEKYRL